MEKITLDATERCFKNSAIIRLSQHGFTKGKSCLTDLIPFCNKVIYLMGEGKAVDIAFLDFRKAFDAIPHSNIPSELFICEMSRYMIGCVRNWLNVGAPGGIVNGATSGWQPATSSVPQGSILGLVLFDIFNNDLEGGVECTLCKFTDNVKLGGAGDSHEGQNTLQRDLERLQHWVIINGMKLNKNKCQILHLGWSNIGHKHKLGEEWLESSPAERGCSLTAGLI